MATQDLATATVIRKLMRTLESALHRRSGAGIGVDQSRRSRWPA